MRREDTDDLGFGQTMSDGASSHPAPSPASGCDSGGASPSCCHVSTFVQTVVHRPSCSRHGAHGRLTRARSVWVAEGWGMCPRHGETHAHSSGSRQSSTNALTTVDPWCAAVPPTAVRTFPSITGSVISPVKISAPAMPSAHAGGFPNAAAANWPSAEI